jgi:hypothetical protein
MSEDEWKEELQKSVQRLQELRDEVRVRLHLAKMEAKEEWGRLEDQLYGAERAASQASQSSRELVAKALHRLEAFRRLLG